MNAYFCLNCLTAATRVKTSCILRELLLWIISEKVTLLPVGDSIPKMYGISRLCSYGLRASRVSESLGVRRYGSQGCQGDGVVSEEPLKNGDENGRKSEALLLNMLRSKSVHPGMALDVFYGAAAAAEKGHSYRTYFAMMVFLGRKKRFEDLDRLLEGMDRDGVKMNEMVLSTLIRLYGRAGKLKKAFQTFRDMEQCGLIRTATPSANLLWCLLKSGRYNAMPSVYQSLLTAGLPMDTRLYNVLIEGLCKAERTQEAMKLLDLMRQKGPNSSPDNCSYKMLICSFCKAKEFEKAYQLLLAMLEEGCVPDVVIFTEIIKGFCKRQNVHVGYEIFDIMVKRGCVPSVVTFNVLISGALAVGDVQNAVNYLDEMRKINCEPDILTYTTLINGLCKAGKPEKACKALCTMHIDDHSILSRPYKLVTTSLLKAGKVRLAYKLLNHAMNEGYSVDAIMYTEVVDHLFLVGNVHEANCLMEKIKELAITNHKGEGQS